MKIQRDGRAGYELFVEPKDKVMTSVPEYPIRIAFCFESLGGR